MSYLKGCSDNVVRENVGGYNFRIVEEGAIVPDGSGGTVRMTGEMVVIHDHAFWCTRATANEIQAKIRSEAQ